MITTIIIISLLLIINTAPYVTNKEYPQLRIRISKMLLILTTLTAVLLFFSTIGIRLKGAYSFRIINAITIITSLAYLGLENRIIHKVIGNLILIPLILLCAYSFVFYYKNGTYKINDKLNIVVSSEGFLGCGQTLRLTTNKLLILDKELKHITHLCLTGISSIKPSNINDEYLELLIQHDEIGDSENPYYYKIENNNEW